MTLFRTVRAALTHVSSHEPAATENESEDTSGLHRRLLVTKLAAAAAGTAGLTAAIVVPTLAHGGTASPVDALLGTKLPAACATAPATSRVVTGVTANGRTWKADFSAEASNATAVSHGYSAADIDRVCNVVGSAIADGFNQSKVLGNESATKSAKVTAQHARTADALTVAEGERLYGAQLSKSSTSSPAALKTRLQALETQGSTATGDALIHVLAQVKTLKAELQLASSSVPAPESDAVTAFVKKGLPRDVSAEFPGAPSGGASAPKGLTTDERTHLEASYSALHAPFANAQSTLEARLVSEAGAPYGKATPPSVQEEVLKRAASGQKFIDIARGLLVEYRAQSGKWEADAPSVEKLISPTVAAETFGDAPTAADLQAAEKEWKAGGSDEEIKAAVVREIAARPWKATPVAMRLAPSGMSEAQQYQYYAKLANSITPLAKLPKGQPILLFIRGLSRSGDVHNPNSLAYGYPDVMVRLEDGHVDLFDVDTNPQQNSTSSDEQAQGYVGALQAQKAYFGSADGAFNGGDSSLRLHQMNENGQPTDGQTVYVTYNKNKDGTLSDDYQSGQAHNGTATAVKVHIGPYSVACLTIRMDEFGKLVMTLKRNATVILGEATPRA